MVSWILLGALAGVMLGVAEVLLGPLRLRHRDEASRTSRPEKVRIGLQVLVIAPLVGGTIGGLLYAITRAFL